jgi:hypothetical protein
MINEREIQHFYLYWRLSRLEPQAHLLQLLLLMMRRWISIIIIIIIV